MTNKDDRRKHKKKEEETEGEDWARLGYARPSQARLGQALASALAKKTEERIAIRRNKQKQPARITINNKTNSKQAIIKNKK